MEILEDRWLSAIFGHGVFKIDPLVNGYASSVLKDLLSQHASRQSAAMYYTKVATDRVDVVRRLNEAEFYVVDVNITLRRDAKCSPVYPSPAVNVSIDEIRPNQHQAVLDIAETCFQFSRFHLDPFIPKKIANQIKRDWVLSYLRKQRGDRLFVALLNEQVVAFLAVLTSEADGKRIRTIDLIGVHRAFQGRGIGQALLEFFVRRYENQYDLFQAGTQVLNVPSIRLYQKFGFSIASSTYVMHRHVRGNDPKAESEKT